jgi:hypothetical protein
MTAKLRKYEPEQDFVRIRDFLVDTYQIIGQPLNWRTCELLHSLHKGLHTDSCVKNMKAIREMGLEAWLTSGKRYVYWGEVDD